MPSSREQRENMHPANTGGPFLDPCHDLFGAESNRTHADWHLVTQVFQRLGVTKEIPHDKSAVFEHARQAIEALRRIRKSKRTTISPEELSQIISKLKLIRKS